MKRLRVRWSKRGRKDLNALIDNIERTSGSTTIALNYMGRLEARCQRIGDAPRAGRARDDLSPGLRTVSFERSALICYIIEDDRVLITNIFRRGRDVDAFFLEEVDAPARD